MTIPKTMRCIEITKFGGPEALKLVSRTVPTIGNDEVLIKIVAAGINRPDIFQRQGLYAPPENVTDIPGLEVSGKVVAKGSKVVNFQINDNVCALVPGGGMLSMSMYHPSNVCRYQIIWV